MGTAQTTTPMRPDPAPPVSPPTAAPATGPQKRTRDLIDYSSSSNAAPPEKTTRQDFIDFDSAEPSHHHQGWFDPEDYTQFCHVPQTSEIGEYYDHGPYVDEGCGYEEWDPTAEQTQHCQQYPEHDYDGDEDEPASQPPEDPPQSSSLI